MTKDVPAFKRASSEDEMNHGEEKKQPSHSGVAPRKLPEFGKAAQAIPIPREIEDLARKLQELLDERAKPPG